MRLHQRAFELHVDGQGISTARLRDTLPDTVSLLAGLFVGIHVRPGVGWREASVRPLHSAVQLNAELTCALCERRASMELHSWSICPLCISWICTLHIVANPARRCPRCPNQLFDYLGASSSSPYVDAFNFYMSLPDPDLRNASKHHMEVANVFRRCSTAFLYFVIFFDL